MGHISVAFVINGFLLYGVITTFSSNRLVAASPSNPIVPALLYFSALMPSRPNGISIKTMALAFPHATFKFCARSAVKYLTLVSDLRPVRLDRRIIPEHRVIILVTRTFA
jgi:hypothetical protein